MEKYIFDQSNGLWYELQGDYYIPCLVLDKTGTSPIGRWGRKHQQYLKEHRTVLYFDLVLSGKLHSCLADIDSQARNKLHLLVTQLAEKEGINEQQKSQDQIAWGGAISPWPKPGKQRTIRLGYAVRSRWMAFFMCPSFSPYQQATFASGCTKKSVR